MWLNHQNSSTLNSLSVIQIISALIRISFWCHECCRIENQESTFTFCHVAALPFPHKVAVCAHEASLPGQFTSAQPLREALTSNVPHSRAELCCMRCSWVTEEMWSSCIGSWENAVRVLHNEKAAAQLLIQSCSFICCLNVTWVSVSGRKVYSVGRFCYLIAWDVDSLIHR